MEATEGVPSKRPRSEGSTDEDKQRKNKRWKYNRNSEAFHALQHKQGILVTCDGNRQRESAAEVMTLLEERVPKLQEQEEEDNTTASLDIAAALNAEIAALRAPKKRKAKNSSLILHNEFKVKGIYFVEINKLLRAKVDPEALVKEVLLLASTKGAITRFTSRMIPVQRTCHASLEELMKVAQELMDPIFNQPDCPRRKVCIVLLLYSYSLSIAFLSKLEIIMT